MMMGVMLLALFWLADVEKRGASILPYRFFFVDPYNIGYTAMVKLMGIGIVAFASSVWLVMRLCSSATPRHGYSIFPRSIRASLALSIVRIASVRRPGYRRCAFPIIVGCVTITLTFIIWAWISCTRDTAWYDKGMGQCQVDPELGLTFLAGMLDLSHSPLDVVITSSVATSQCDRRCLFDYITISVVLEIGTSPKSTEINPLRFWCLDFLHLVNYSDGQRPVGPFGLGSVPRAANVFHGTHRGKY